MPQGTDYGTHLSKPLTIEIPAQGATSPVETILWLAQPVMPWTPASVYLDLVAGAVRVTMPIDEARSVLESIGQMVSRAFPVYQLDDHDDYYPSDVSRRYGSPAGADDDNCPACETFLWVTWLGEDDEQNNVWFHECGLQWRNKVRRPGSGVEYVQVIPAAHDDWEIFCLACLRREFKFPTEEAAQAAADAHVCEPTS